MLPSLVSCSNSSDKPRIVDFLKGQRKYWSMAAAPTTVHIEDVGERGKKVATGVDQHREGNPPFIPDSYETPISEHDFHYAHGNSRAPSQKPTMADTTGAASYFGGPQRRGKYNRRKLVLCFDGTGNKFHGDDSDSNILKIFRMLDRTANDQCESPSPGIPFGTSLVQMLTRMADHYYQRMQHHPHLIKAITTYVEEIANACNPLDKAGIGTYVVSKSLTHTSLRSRFKSWYMKAKDSAVGSSFDQHVVGGYRFLMRFYSPGDDIYIFGFSRGAYIARFLAEMLDYVGLLSHGNEEMVAFAWKAFSQWQCRRSAGADDFEGQKKKAEMYEFLKGFRETFSRPVRRIRFLGLFDTVNSVPRFETAWMERSKFPYTARSSARVIRHAVSIDERRAKFRQDLMYQSQNKSKNRQHEHDHHHHHHHDPVGQMMHGVHEKYRSRPALTPVIESPNEKTRGMGQTEERGRRPSQIEKFGSSMLGAGDRVEPAPYRQHSRSKSRATHHTCDTVSEVSQRAPYDDGDEDTYESENETEQDIDEIWFAGGHGDVGGGWAVEAGTKSTSHVPLVWMIRQAMKAGLSFDVEKVVKMGCSEALRDTDTSNDPHTQNGNKARPTPTLPGIRIYGSSPPTSPHGEKGVDSQNNDENNDENNEISPTATVTGQQQSPFDEMMHKAHLARIHDSLSFDCGMSLMSVLAWKVMEYLPFRRMDLQRDGSWKPIRWPLPCGEVRDIPDNVRVHGSVIRRMKLDKSYRPGNLIVGGGGRGCKVAPNSYGIGEWECIENQGDPVGEVWKRRN